MTAPTSLPECILGKTQARVTRLGLGGEGILRTFGCEVQARAVIEAALDAGITYCDSARAYAGSESYYGASLGRRRERIFLTSKAHDRTSRGALRMLDHTLTTMRVSHLDLWQLHDLRTWEELDAVAAPGGAYEAFVEAKRAGKVRFIGVTGHHDPQVLLSAILRLDFDTVLLPINPCEPYAGAFAAQVAPAAMARGMGVIGMKVLARGLLPRARAASIPELIAYALSQPVHVVIIGWDDPHQVRQSVDAARGFRPMPAAAQRQLEQRLRPVAPGCLYYRGDLPHAPAHA